MKKGNTSVLLRVLSYLKPFKKEFLLAGFFLALSTLIGFLQPLIIQEITDKGMLERNVTTLFRAVAILSILIVLNQCIELAQNRLFIKVHNQSFYAIFNQVFHKLLHLKKAYFEDKNNAEIINYLQTDVSQVSSVTDRYTVTSVSYIFRIISGLAGLLIISWKLTLIVLAMVPIKVILVKHFSRQRESAMEKVLEENRDFSRWFGDNLEGINEIKLWGLFEGREKSFQEKQKKILQYEKKNSMIDAWNTFSEMMLEWGVSILLYLVGGLFVCQGNLTVGSVFAFSSYSWYVTGPVSAILNLKMYFAQILPSARRLFQFLDMDTEQDYGTRRVSHIPPRLEFKDVTFFYQKNRPILHNVNFHADPGEKIAIIGKNGSGKSTLINLLLRFYTPMDGEIFADHIPISQYILDDYRALYSVVSQAPYLFLGEISDNIDLSRNATEGAICSAMEASGVTNFLQHMPDAEKTQIGRNGTKLSGGEKQKIAVARALLKDAPVIILDEATSGFDRESDLYLHDIIVNHMENKTVIMITHHYEHLEGMDRIYKLEGGVLREVE